MEHCELEHFEKEKIILFFDETCELCSRFIQFVSKRDKNNFFLFAPLQGQTAKKHLELKDIENLSSLFVLKEAKLYREEQALKLILKKLYPYSSLLLGLIPSFLQNKMYRFIAKRRYQWFGKRETGVLSSDLNNSLLT